jgi:hypothetical protein
VADQLIHQRDVSIGDVGRAPFVLEIDLYIVIMLLVIPDDAILKALVQLRQLPSSSSSPDACNGAAASGSRDAGIGWGLPAGWAAAAMLRLQGAGSAGGRLRG